MHKLETLAELRLNPSDRPAPGLTFIPTHTPRSRSGLWRRMVQGAAFLMSCLVTRPVPYKRVITGADEGDFPDVTTNVLFRIQRKYALSTTVELYELGGHSTPPEQYLIRDKDTGENAVISAAAVRILFKKKG